MLPKWWALFPERTEHAAKNEWLSASHFQTAIDFQHLLREVSGAK